MKIAVAMSGGVDSSVTAILLKKAGHEVTGITARLTDTDSDTIKHIENNSYFSNKSIEDAKRIADQYGIPHHVIDIRSDFLERVIEPFCDEYLKGRTPSPCIRCNAIIKFGLLFEEAKKLGCEKIATGHYAQIATADNGRYYIKRGIDEKKDQSYFLFMLSQDVLANILFPLGEYTKVQIAELARDLGLHIKDKPESQEICFIPDNDYKSFIEVKRGKLKDGEIVDPTGKVLGTHSGIHNYTVGQRRGLGIAAPKPLYVVKIDTESNRVIVGYKEALECRGLVATDVRFMKENDFKSIRGFVKTRSTQKPVSCSVEHRNSEFIIIFDEILTGITPGQGAVVYDDNGGIIAGGWIEKSF